MNYKEIVIEDLRNYNYLKQGVENAKARIRALEYAAVGLQAGEPVRAGRRRSARDDRMVDNIAERERLKLNLRTAQTLLRMIDSALSTLSEQEREILNEFYINKREGHAERLCHRFCVEKSKVYTMKDEALRKMAIGMYGVIEL